MPADHPRRLTLLLILATLGALLILYRLASIGVRHGSGSRKTRPSHGVPIDERDDNGQQKLGERIWKRRIVAVGDLHGDLNNAQSVLRMAGIIDGDATWIAGEDVLVQTGDIVDRGTDTIALYRLFQRLRSESRAQGGDVHSILGNHEIMNAIGDWRYVTPEDIATFGGSEERQSALSTEGWIGAEWLANYSVAARVPLSPYHRTSSSSDAFLSFSHGSLHPYLPLLTPFPSNPNDLAHSLLTKALGARPMPKPYPPHPYPGLPPSATPDERELYGSEGIVWWRGLATEPDERKACEWVRTLQRRLGVRRVIGGHTPDFEKIVSRCDGGAIIIDTGISKAYGGVLSALEIEYTLHELLGDDEKHGAGELSVDPDEEQQRQHRFEAKKQRSRRVREREIVTAVYPHGRVRLAKQEGVVELFS